MMDDLLDWLQEKADEEKLEKPCWNWERTVYVRPGQVAAMQAIKVEYHREWLVTLKNGQQLQVGDDLGIALRDKLEQKKK